MLKHLVLLVFLGECFGFYPSNSDVIELTSNNFDESVTDSENFWIVEFFAPWCGHCKELVPDYQRLASSLKGIIKVGAVNADEHEGLSERFSVEGFPTIKIFGANKNEPLPYSGPRTAEGIANGLMVAVKEVVISKLKNPGKGSAKGAAKGPTKGAKDPEKSSAKCPASEKKESVTELTDSNFEKLVLQSEDLWLVDFYAPRCGHCKNLAPQWAEAAKELEGKFKLGALDGTANTKTAQKYGIHRYPTIKYFPLDKKLEETYSSGLTAASIVNWASEKWMEKLPSPDVIQITDEELFKDNCNQKPLCVISVLPNILDCPSGCRNKYLGTMKAVAENYKKNLWGWLWTEAGVQDNLENSLDIGGFGYPAMAVISPKKQKYSVLRGSFSKDGINDFLKDISYGRGKVLPLREGNLPQIVETEAWDGQDGELPSEEDVDLSDVSMDDIKDEL